MYGLKNELINNINSIFRDFPAIESVTLFGSRAMGNFKPGSDIDLAISGHAIDLEMMNSIRTQSDDLLTPYTFDLCKTEQIKNQQLLDHIQRVGKVLYLKNH